MSSKTPSKAEQARNLTGRQHRDAIEPLRSAILIAKWNAASYDDPNVTRVWIRKADFPTMDAAAQALSDVGLPTGLDFTQYGRGNYDFADFGQLIHQAALKAVTTTPAPAIRLVVTDAVDSGSEEGTMPRKQQQAIKKADAEAQDAAEQAISPTKTKTKAAVKPKADTKPTGDGILWPEGVKHCNKCDTDKPRSDFASNKSAKDGSYHMCKACESEYNRIRRVAKAAAGGGTVKAEVPANKGPVKTTRIRNATAPIVADTTEVSTPDDVTEAIAARLA
jgi:hypothetical protein